MGGGEDAEPLEPLKLTQGAATPRLAAILAQTGAALFVIFLASHLFVRQLGHLGPVLGLPPQLLALFLSPIATELPETMNAIIWVRQGKHRLALCERLRRDDDPGDDPHIARAVLHALAARSRR